MYTKSENKQDIHPNDGTETIQEVHMQTFNYSDAQSMLCGSRIAEIRDESSQAFFNAENGSLSLACCFFSPSEGADTNTSLQALDIYDDIWSVNEVSMTFPLD